MSVSNRLEVVDGMGQYRLTGTHRFQQVVRIVAQAICTCREQGLRKMLLVTTEVAGFDSPSVLDRHVMVRTWAEAAQGKVKIALVARPEFIDAEKFGVVAAANFGLTGDAFTTEAEALAWLQEG